MNEALNTGTAEPVAPPTTETVILPTGPVPTILEEPIAAREAQSPEVKKEEDKGAVTETKTAEDKDKGTAEAKPAEAPAKTEDDLESEEIRYDKIPRFKELQRKVKENDERALKSEERAIKAEAVNAHLLQRLEAMERQIATPKEEPSPAVNIDVRSLEEIAERDGLGAALLQVYQKAKEDTRNEVSAEYNQRTTTERLTSELKAFSAENSDFMDLFNSGELSRIADSSPLYSTPISAYLKLKLDRELTGLKAQRDSDIQTAVDKARQEERDIAEKKLKEMEDNFKAKKSITNVSERATPQTTKAEPIDSGGDRGRTLYRRFLERQSGV